MKRIITSAFALLMLCAFSSTVSAQSLGDLFNKNNINKVVNAVTGANKNVQLEGTWVYTGSAIEFESDNLLMKAGGAAASSAVEKQLDEQLSKFGIAPGRFSFTFNADSTFVSTVGNRPVQGTYTYDAETKQLQLKYLRLMNMNSTLSYTVDDMQMLFNSDKLLKLVAFLSSKSNSGALKGISTLATKYDGMMLGFDLKKQE